LIKWINVSSGVEPSAKDPCLTSTTTDWHRCHPKTALELSCSFP
jgi:hypothetical protein